MSKLTRNQKARPGAPLRNVVRVEDRYYPYLHLDCGHYVEMKPAKWVISVYDIPAQMRCSDCVPLDRR